jgi:glycosyltransferase involved in cell wall biosynthesis
LTVSGLRDQNVDAEIVTYDAAKLADKNILEEDYIHFLPPPLEQKFAYSKAFSNFLDKKKYDLYHCQGIWQYPAHITAKKARKFNVPYIITPRGMLYPQEFERSGIAKKIALALFQKQDINAASCIHATCKEEMYHLRELGITAPVAVIPNPVETEPYLEQKVNTPDKIRFGYLGRIHTRKNIERILYAWDRMGSKVSDAELIIIGSGDKQYHNFLKKETERLQLNNVEFTGFLSGKAKERKLSSLSYLVVPSNFENFGMIIAELLVRGIPVIASKGTPWRDLEMYQCGWWVENDLETLVKKMRTALHLPDAERIKMGRRGKNLISEKYTIQQVAIKMKAMYDWVLGNSAKPDYIYLND